MCVYYIAHRHHMLTDEHVEILNQVWSVYEYPPLPASPPPEMAEWNERVREAKEAVAEAQRPFLAGQNPFTREFDPLMAVKHQVDGLVSAQQALNEVLEQQPGVQVWASQPTHIFFDEEGDTEYAPDEHELAAAERRREWEDAYGRMNQSRQEWEVLEEQRLQRQVGEPELIINEQEQQQGQQDRPCTCDDCIRQQGLNTARYLNPEDYEAEHQETCSCEICDTQDRQVSCDADRCTYECGQACGASEPVELPETKTIDLTCEKPVCNYGCICNEAKNLLAPAEGCLYGCNYACGTNYGENCTAIFDADGNQVMPEDDMPPLVPLAAYATPRGWLNPEEDSEDEGVAVPTVAPQPQQQQPKPPKEKSLFPYNHPRWPSPRAKALVKGMIARGETSLVSIASVLDKPIKSLNHDICMHYLAKRYRLTPEQLLETSIYELHNPPTAPYWGVSQCGCSFCRREKRGY